MTPAETTRNSAVLWRAFVGPPWQRSGSGTFWDWTGLSLGSAYTFPPAETVLSASITSASSSLGINSGSYPAKGGIWVGPGATGEEWEYISYTTNTSGTLSGLVREPVTQEQDGTHTAGAPVRFWWELDLSEGPDLTSQMGDRLSDTAWSASLSGYNYPRAALRNKHLVVVQSNWFEGAGSGGSGWKTELIGWLQSPKVSDTVQDPKTWTATLVSARQMLDLIKISGLRVGQQNVAVSGDAVGSDELFAAYKEWGSGEFVPAEPRLDPDSVLDTDITTLYISERMVGTSNDPSDNSHPYSLNAPDQVHIAPYVGQGRGYRWIQVRAGYSPSYDWGLVLHNPSGYWPGDHRGGLWWTGAGQHKTETGNPLVIVENEILFRQENPNLDDCEVFEVSENKGTQFSDSNGYVTYTASQWWDAMPPAGGWLIVRISQGASLHNVAGRVVWGNAVVNDPPWWTGAGVPAPASGQTIRRLWSASGNQNSGFSVGKVSTPGYWLSDTDSLWLAVSTRTMGLRLRDTITSGTTTLYLVSYAGESLDGLSPSGTIQIGDEQITYTGKSATNDYLTGVTRGTGGTTAAAHTSGDTVYFVEGGVATEAAPITSMTLLRPAGKPVPKNFKVYGSKLGEPRSPEAADWEQDYTLLATVTDNTLATYTLTLPSPARYRHILVSVTMMSVDPGRLMLNEFQISADLSVFSSERTLVTATIAEAQEALLSMAGFPAAAVVDAGGTPTVADYTTDSGMAGEILADLADYGGCRFDVGRDSKVTLRPDPFWGIPGVPTETLQWDDSIAMGWEGDFLHGLNTSQVRLYWRNAANTEYGVVRYPEPAYTLGDVVDQGPYVYADAAAAAIGAAKRFWMARRPYGILVPAAGAPWNRSSGEVVGFQWTVEGSDQVLDRTYLVTVARHASSQVKLESVFQLLQISGNGDI